jgi:hypothetical protein
MPRPARSQFRCPDNKYTARLFESLPQIVRPVEREERMLLASTFCTRVRIHVRSGQAYTQQSYLPVSPQQIFEHLREVNLYVM